MHTLNEAWKQYKCRFKGKYYKKYSTDEERMENRPETVPLEDFKMLMKYWGDESVQVKKLMCLINNSKHYLILA